MKVPKFITRGLASSCMALAWAGLCLVQVARAEENPSSFDAANQAFVRGKPAEAAHTLEGIVGKQGFSSPVLFNLANAQLRAGTVADTSGPREGKPLYYQFVMFLKEPGKYW